MLRRTSSFKRRVKSGQSTSKSDAASKILIQGDLKLSHQLGKGLRFLPGFAVAYAGKEGGLMIAVHKSAKDFTPFRSFPEDVTYFGAARTVDEAPSNIPGLPSNCLQLESIDDASQPPVLLNFSSRDLMGAWMQALRSTKVPSPVRSTPDKADSEAASSQAAFERRLEMARQQLDKARAMASAEREEARRISRESSRIQAEYERMVEKLHHELDADPTGTAVASALSTHQKEQTIVHTIEV